VLAVSSPALASLPLEKYEQPHSPGVVEIMHADVNGVGNGYAWANGVLLAKGQKLLFCPPPDLALNQDNFLALLDGEIKRQRAKGSPYGAETDVEKILGDALQHAFPCK
jgi:hypothetical protein